MILLAKPTIILQPSATIRQDFTVANCNKHCKIVRTKGV